MSEHEESPIVGWDGDNTLWGWLEYAVPAYEAMCEVLAEIAGKKPGETAEAMKAFYTTVGSIENEGLVQGLHAAGFFSGVRDFDEAATIDRVMQTFARVQEENMRLYPGIAETVAEIHARGYRQILVSDAPIHKATARLQDTGLSDLIYPAFGMPSAEVPRRPRSRPRPPIHPDFVLHKEKPHSSNELALKLQLTRAELARLLTFIGDSDPKDMGYARRIGCVGIHSLWGVADPKLVERILKFAPKGAAKRHMQIGKDASSLVGNARILNAQLPKDVLKILEDARRE